MPEFVAYEDNLRTTGPVFFGQKISAQRRLHAEHLEQVIGDLGSMYALR
jgi:hypothetical protein